MSYFPGVFITQYHKSRAGYFVNHDLIANGNPTDMQLPHRIETNSYSTILLKIYLKNSISKTLLNTNEKGIYLAITEILDLDHQLLFGLMPHFSVCFCPPHLLF